MKDFHNHLNSSSPHIEFTVEMPTISAEGQTIAFLDTNNTVSANGQVEVGVHRKPTHTNKYLPFESLSPAQSKRAVVKTLMDRAKYLPLTSERKQSKKQQVISDLKVNGYPQNFIESCLDSAQVNKQPENQESPRGYASFPYVKGVSESVRRVLSKENNRTTFKPVKALGGIFKKRKDRPSVNQIKGIESHQGDEVNKKLLYQALQNDIISSLYFEVIIRRSSGQLTVIKVNMAVSDARNQDCMV